MIIIPYTDIKDLRIIEEALHLLSRSSGEDKEEQIYTILGKISAMAEIKEDY
jgi:hypothetical protein